MQKNTGIVLIGLAFWMQGLFYDWETSLFYMVLAVFAAIVLLMRKRLHVKMSAFEAISYGLYAGGFLVHAIWSGTAAAQAALLQSVTFGLFVFLLGILLQTREDVKSWYKAVYWIIIAEVLYGWLIKGESLLESVFGYANMVAALCLFALPIGVHSWRMSSGRNRWVYFGSVIMLLLSLGATQARIAWALAALCMFVQFTYATREIDRKRLFALILAVFAIGCVAVVVLPFSFPVLWQSLTQTSSLRLRLTYDWDAIRFLLHSPLTGAGPGVWEHLQYQYQTALYHVVHVHNHLLQIWLDGGLLSAIGFLGFILLIVKDGIKLFARNGTFSFVFSAWLATASVLIYGFFDFVLSFPAMFMAISVYTVVRNHFLSNADGFTLSIGKLSIRVAVILLLSVGTVQAVREINALRMQSALAQGELRTALAWEKEPSWVLPSETRNYLLGMAYSEKAKRSRLGDDWEQAILYFHRGISENPSNLRMYPLNLYAHFQLGRYAESVNIAFEWVQRQPSMTMPYTQYAIALQKAGRFQELRNIPELMAKHKKKVLEDALFPRHIPALRPTAEMKAVLDDTQR